LEAVISYRFVRLIAVVSLILTLPGPATAQEDNYCAPEQAPAYASGFAELKAYVGEPMGDPVTCEYADPDGTGNVLQQTTTGTALWRAGTSTSIFTAGSDHWAVMASGQVSWSGPDLDPPAVSAEATEPAFAPISRASIYWGAYIAGVPASTVELDAFEAAIGKRVSIVHWGQSWGRPPGNAFQRSRFDTVRGRGSIPMLNWGSWELGPGENQPAFRLSTIANGTYDAHIERWAQAAREWGHPFFLRFDHEMNGGWEFPWSVQMNGNKPADYVAAWRHVHDIFVQQGATNATWVWCPNISGSRTTPLDQVYPGDDYVDWTCLDGYNFGTSGGNLWQSFSQVFGGAEFGGYNTHNSYQELLALAPSKPIMLGEVASAEEGGSKAGWINDMLQSLPTTFPRIKAVVWFDWSLGDPNITWPVASSRESLTAFANGIASPTYASNDFGNLSSRPIQPLVASDPSAPNAIVLTPIADTFTSRDAPSSTSGGSGATLRVDMNGTDTAFLLFDLSTVACRTFSSATLRLHTSPDSWARSQAVFDVRLVTGTSWKEEWMSYRNSTPVSSTVLGTLGGPKWPNTWYDIILKSSSVQERSGGLLALALTARASDVWIVNSRESGASTAPQLVIACA
jgi:hypothetical protein